MKYIEIGKKEGKLVTGGTGDNSKGYFIQPTIFADVDPKAVIMQEEIFGPVVAFTKAKDFDEAIEIANNTEYGLTGAVISNNREHIEKAKEDFHVGNLYINRGCTAAVVGHQPFGGFNMSGTDSKAGGPDYFYYTCKEKAFANSCNRNTHKHKHTKRGAPHYGALFLCFHTYEERKIYEMISRNLALNY